MVHEMRSSFSFGTIFTFLAYFVLTILFLVEFFICIDKFVTRGTTATMSSQYVLDVQVPAITICRQGFKGMSNTNFEYESMANLDTICAPHTAMVVTTTVSTTSSTSTTTITTTTTTTITTTGSTTTGTGSTTTSTTTTTRPMVNYSPYDMADVWNKCLNQSYHTRTESIERIYYATPMEAFWKPLVPSPDEAMTQYTPFFSKYGHCYTMKPPANKRIRTNVNEGMIVMKVQPGMYTVMVHDPRLIPVSSEAPDVLAMTPISVNMPNVTLPNNTMQYVLIAMKEKLMTLPDRIDEPRFGAKPCRDNDMWSDTMLRAMVQKVGCQLDMQKLYNASVAPACRTRVEMNNFLTNMSAINRFSASEMAIKLNSPPLCHFRIIDASLNIRMSSFKKDFPELTNATGVSNTGNFIMFYYDSPRVQLITDQLFYDGANLVGEIGGALALFLALSLVDLIKVFKLCGKKLSGSNKPI